MADTKISGLTALATPAGEDLLAIVDDPSGAPTSKKITVETLLSAYTVSSANTAVLKATGYSLTGSDATSAIDIAGTWNTTGTPTGIKFNVTDTASNAASLLMDLQVGGTSQFALTKSGVLKLKSATYNTTLIRLGFDNYGIGYNPNGEPVFVINTIARAAIGVNATLSNVGYFGFDPSGAVGGTPDTRLYRDAANTLALRNSTNAQTFNIYNTYTDASNYERGSIKWSSNVFTISAEAAGTGTARNIAFNFGGHGNAPIDMSTPASNLVKLRFYRPSSGSIGGGIQATNGLLNIYGGSADSPASGDATVTLGSTTITLDPHYAASTSATNTIYLGGNLSNASLTRRIKADQNTSRARDGTVLRLEGGDAYDGGATNRNGGNVVISGGAPANSGSYGYIVLENLPTSASGLPTGALWSNAGVLTVA